MNLCAPARCGPDFLAEMDVQVEKQAVVLLLSVMFGTGAGLLYDILRPLRHRLSRGFTPLLKAMMGMMLLSQKSIPS